MLQGARPCEGCVTQAYRLPVVEKHRKRDRRSVKSERIEKKGKERKGEGAL